MEDSGIDSDSKTNSNGSAPGPSQPSVSKQSSLEDEAEPTIAVENVNAAPECTSKTTQDVANSKSRALLLQKRLEKHIQHAKKIRQQNRNDCVDTQPKKSLLPRSRAPLKTFGRCRLSVPSKGQATPTVPTPDMEPLVTWESGSEDEFEFHPTSKTAAREMAQQLIRDGYHLDLTPDDDDLDLIPPRPLDQRCSCCAASRTCSIM
ncbi:protein FAM219A-like isoform X2 [Ornithodoros turicata]|uniref:protein FAM219A-like isoform X2 n=1 Tax=Ornithodoros turicata TaxID=34597 RepID=UPI003139DDA3